VGLFRTLMPHAVSLLCQVLGGRGAFRLGPMPVGVYYIATAAVPRPNHIADLFAQDFPRACSGAINVVAGVTPDPLKLVVRAPAETDIPILPAFPLLLIRASRAARYSDRYVATQKFPSFGSNARSALRRP
jgi:hypothetical protein